MLLQWQKFQKIHPFWIAIGIALVVTIIYIFSGRGNFDLNTRELEKSDQVKQISTSDHNSIIITCKNGQQYEIVYPIGQSNFQDLVYDKCGK